MKLLTNFFKSKPKKNFETKYGVFELVYNKRNKSLWTTKVKEILLSVRGSEESPDLELLQFLETFQDEIEKLNNKITRKFRKEFKKAGLGTTFTDWQDKFTIVAVQVMMIFEGEAFWNITFEDKEEPFSQFTIFIEGQKINNDFAIDT